MLAVLTFRVLLIAYIIAKRQLIHNRTAERISWNQSYDFIVVGAGGSGCVVANRLTEDPNISLLLLEAGGPQQAINTDIPGLSPSYITPEIQFVYYSEPQNNLKINNSSTRRRLTAGRIIGGSTSHNEMFYYRAQRRDLDNWANTYGAMSWSFQEVLPFYLRFENNTDLNISRKHPHMIGVNGPVQISSPENVDPIVLITKKVYNDLGFMDTYISAVNQTGTMFAQNYIDQNGFRSESGNAYVDPNPHPNNLHIVTNSWVLRILFNGLTAVGVEFSRNDTSYRVYARKEVIISCGPYQSPQLLMLSGVGPRNHLMSFGIPVLLDLPVGDNFQNLLSIFFNFNISQNLFNPPPVLTIDNLIKLYFYKTGPLSKIPWLLLYLSTPSNLETHWPNVVLGSGVINGVFLFQAVIGRIKSKGTVRLQSNNPYIPPKLDLNIYSEPSDLDNCIEAVKFVLFIFERTRLSHYVSPVSFESVGCPPCPERYSYECTDSIRCYILSQVGVAHPAGTCRMGSIGRTDIVVDPSLRVKHANNLRVCDTSIIPELPNSGLTAEALMIGEKCAQIVKDYYGLK